MRINFASTRLAFVLISTLLALIIVSALIPQQEIAVGQIADLRQALGSGYAIIEWLRLDDIYTAPYFFVLLGLLGLNLTMANIKRFRIIFRSGQTLLRLRHLGSIIFHFSLLLIIAAVIANYLLKYRGEVALTEGQTVEDSSGIYAEEFKGALYKGSYNRFTMTLDSIYESEVIPGTIGTAVDITVDPAGKRERKATIMINRPHEIADLTYHYALTKGYSPEIKLTDSAGRSLYSAFMRLAVTQDDELGQVHHDFYELEPFDLRITVQVLADSISIGDTLYWVALEQGDSSLYEGELRPGDAVKINQYQFSIPRLREWCYITIVNSPFLGLIFLGFWLALAGMSISLISRVLPKERK